MTLPGWYSLDAVRSIDSGVQIVTLCFWSLLVIFEALAFLWKRRATLFTISALVAFAAAVGGEVLHFKYDNRREVLYDAHEEQLRKDHAQELKSAKEDARKSAESAGSAQRQAEAAKKESEKAHAIQQQGSEELAKLKEREKPRTITPEQKGKILEAMRGTKVREITVVHAADLESQNYADLITEVLTAAGWTVKPPPFRMITRSAPGVVIMVHDIKVPEPEAGQLQFAFKSAGIELGGATQEQVAAGQLEMWVGPKNPVSHP